MKSPLHNCGRLEIRSSGIEGYGVFATEDISAGEILEEVPFILFPKYTSWGKEDYERLSAQSIISDREKFIENLRRNLGFKDPEKYYFKWEPPVADLSGGDPLSFMVLPLGYGPIYNTSNTQNNAGWKIVDKLFVFVAEKNISKNEEIRTFYGYFLDEQGKIFNVETVFFMGLDMISGQVGLSALRYSSTTHLQKITTDPNYIRLSTFISSRAQGKIIRLKRLEAGGYHFDFPNNWPLGFYYQKLAEFNSAKFPSTRFHIEYNDIEDGQIKKEVVDLPNR